MWTLDRDNALTLACFTAVGIATLGLVALAGVLTSLVVTAGATLVAALRTGRSRWTCACAVGVLMTLALSVQDDPEKSARTMLGLALERAHELLD